MLRRGALVLWQMVETEKNRGNLILISDKLVSIMSDQTGHPSGLPPGAVEKLWLGKVNDAIEQVRVERNIEHEAASELVRTYIMSDRALQRKMIVGQSDMRWRDMRWWILLQAIIGAIVYYLFLREQ